MSKKILHLGSASAFMPSFIDLIKDFFKIEEHRFILTSGMCDEVLKNSHNTIIFNHKNIGAVQAYLSIVFNAHRSDKVILHGLFDPRLIVILSLMPWIHGKLYWVIWGADLYTKITEKKTIKWKIIEFFRRRLLKRIGNLVSYIPGDVENARLWYGAKGKYHESLMYNSNIVNPFLFQERDVVSPTNLVVNILVGNSSDPSNGHIEVFEKLKNYANENIRVYVPLSYGDQSYAKKVMDIGEKYFGSKFIPLTNFMKLDEYEKFLKEIDIAIFNHKRQQAMGNKITLLGMGKTIYMRSVVSDYKFFMDLGLHIKDIDSLNLNQNSKEESRNNYIIASKHFTVENLKRQIESVFEG